MESLIQDLLAYTRVAQSTSLLNLPTPMKRFSAAPTWRELFPDRSAHHGRSAPDGADPPYTSQQLFQNLVSNAIKYHSPERTPMVHVTAKREDGYWTFTISDNGIGVDPQYGERIFGLFKRLHTSGKYSGTGIGLAICQRIVDRYGGRIWVESEPGQGSNFRFPSPSPGRRQDVPADLTVEATSNIKRLRPRCQTARPFRPERELSAEIRRSALTLCH
jgi:light-regulated signal transduction histidine kinase (bacteriophytochrome)